MAADPLQSARTKLDRANLHTRTTRREFKRFFDRHPAATFEIQPEGQQGDEIGAIFGGRIVMTSDVRELPPTFASRFGDALHNYRGALDHLAWQLVPEKLRMTLPKRELNRIQFPIYDTEKSFRDNAADRLPGVSKTVRRYIEARHQYTGGKATNDALTSLARLSNDDKHRELHVFVSRFRTLQSQVTYVRCKPVTWENPPERPMLKKDAVVTYFTCEVTGPNPGVEMQLQPTVEIAIEDLGEVTTLLEGIRREVREILNAPEILAAIG